MQEEKTVADEMAAENEKIAEAIAVQAAEEATPEVETAEEPTIDNIEQFLTDEGQWLEGQIQADTGAYQNCPICSLMPDIFKTLAGALKDTLENLDNLRDSDVVVDDAVLLAMLQRDRAWYLLSKQIAVKLHEEGHAPRNIINAHPELHSLGTAKKRRATASKKKSKRKATRAARRNNR